MQHHAFSVATPPRANREPIDWGTFLPSLAVLCGSSALLGLAIAWGIWRPAAESFLGSNSLASFVRVKMLNTMAGFAIVPAVIGALATLVLRGRGARGVERAARLSSPLALLAAAQVLSAHKYWNAHPLPFLLLLTISVLALEQALRHAQLGLPSGAVERVGELYDRLPVRLRQALPWLVVLVGASGYTAYMSYYSVMQHQRLATYSFDLGIYDNLIANAIHGHPFRTPVQFGSDGGNFLSNHAEFVQLLWAPVYALAPRAETLLILQSAMLGFAAVPLYAFAKTQVPRWSAALLALAYLFFAPLHGPNFYDFHWLPLSIFPAFCLFWAIATRRNVWTWVFFALLVLTREDVSVDLCLFGAYLVLSKRRVLLGAAIAGLAACTFAIIKFVIMKAAGDSWFPGMYKDLLPPGTSGYSPIIKTAFVNPAYFLQTLFEADKLTYVLHLFAPLVFLPARHWKLLVGVCGGFFFTLMTTQYPHTISIRFQYTSHWIPYLFGASAVALGWYSRRADHGVIKRRAALGALLAGVSLHSLAFGAILTHDHFYGGFHKVQFEMTDAERARLADLNAIIAMIPKDASVAATDPETPHISNRVKAYALREDHGFAEYLLLRRQGIDFLKVRSNVQELFDLYDYGLVARRGDFFLFKRGQVSAETTAAMQELGFKVRKK